MKREDISHWIRDELFDAVPVRISVIDRNFHIVEANRAFEESFGPWRDRPCYEVYKDRDRRCDECGAAKTFADGRTRTREEEGVGHDGETQHYLVHMTPLLNSEGNVSFIIEMSTDITQTKLLEKQKLEAERLAAVGQTVAGLAHGVKNVIMGLEGGMYVINSGLRRDDPTRIKQGWSMLEENIARISSFVKEFLEFARGREPHVAVIDPNETARKVIELFRDRGALAGIEVSAGLDPAVAPAPMDEEGLHACLANLVSNALDACEMSERRGHSVRLSTREENGALIFEVSDDGCGMDYDIKRKVFSNFFSTKGSGKGTGLGLLTTRKIVQEHGGRVSFDSVEGEGSVFRLEFPRHRLPCPPADAPA
ncbi:MAG: Blue-light-activated protein [candidate division BRC1 bacterium ADurb.BinA364]|nr:MAG: Blue-light-activated protein [candidate division BRC1 bacterium ADurb.BinA364]